MLKVLGDVHAGKRFINDVPLHRRGEREREVFSQLFDELNVDDEVTTHVQVGDLFDQFEVSNEDLMEVYNSYRMASKSRPRCDYYLIPGNHDLARDSNRVSTFQVLSEMLAPLKNVHVIFQPCALTTKDGVFGFMPWHPFKSARELAAELHEVTVDAVFCHCDIAGETPNLLPTELLSHITSKVYTGHVHTPQTYVSHGVEVIVTGSMQPYSHAEDPKGERYITVDVAKFNDLIMNFADTIKNKYVRLRLPAGVEPPNFVPNCLGFKIIREQAEEEEQEVRIEMKIEDFNTRNLFAQCMDEKGVSPEVKELMLEKFDVSQT